jgi:hypothetical protein
MSAEMYRTRATPRYNLMEGEDFQNNINTSRANTWLSGENNLKKFPGLVVLKYVLAVAIEFGMSLPHDFASIKEE